MPQQINLCAPILTSKKRYFSAQTMAQALAVYWVLGGCLSGVWVWSHNQSSAELRRTLSEQDSEVAKLKQSMDDVQATAKPLDPALQQRLDTLRGLIAQHVQLRNALQKGVLQVGWGHSDRLRLVAQTIPPQVWVTNVKADNTRFEVSGYTLESDALNDWVNRLALSPLMQGLKLSDVRVENTIVATEKPAELDKSSKDQRPMWAFTLLSLQQQAAVASKSGEREMP